MHNSVEHFQVSVPLPDALVLCDGNLCLSALPSSSKAAELYVVSGKNDSEVEE